MTKDEAIEEIARLHDVVKNWRAKDAWHKTVYARNSALVCYVLCANCRDKDPGSWEMPPIPEGVEP